MELKKRHTLEGREHHRENVLGMLRKEVKEVAWSGHTQKKMREH